MAKNKLAEDNLIDDQAPALTDNPPVPEKLGEGVVDEKFTRCWLIRHSAWGGGRIFADTEEEAIAYYHLTHCPTVDLTKLKADLAISELPFKPAATEVGKPYGWKRPIKGKDKKKVKREL